MTDDQLLDFLLATEGSIFTNDPHDAGGPTRWGITLAVLTSWRGHATIADVQGLLSIEARAIYRALYIKPFDTLSGRLRENCIDMAVNAGVYRASILLQQMVGAGVDGWIGPESIKKITGRPDDVWNFLYTGFRLSFYETLIAAKPTQMKWRNGWRSRALSFITPVPKGLPKKLSKAGLFGPMAKAA